MPNKARVAVEQIESMQASAKDRLIDDLRLLRQESGRPSLNELAELSQGEFSRKTIDDHLSGRRTGIPSWRLTSAYIHACQEFARSTGLNIDRLGTIDEWEVRYRAAEVGDVAAISPIRDLKTVATYSMLDLGQKIPPGPGVHNAGVTRQIDYSGTTAGITVADDSFTMDIEKLRESLPVSAGILIVVNSVAIGTRFEIFRDLVTIGRSPESNIFLNDETVSRRHAVIHRYGTEFTVRDVGSRNGTYLHQIKLTAETRLPPNEELQIGVFRMRFVQGIRRQG